MRSKQPAEIALGFVLVPWRAAGEGMANLREVLGAQGFQRSARLHRPKICNQSGSKTAIDEQNPHRAGKGDGYNSERSARR